MKLKLLGNDPLPLAHKLRLPGEVFEISDDAGAALLERYPGKVENVESGMGNVESLMPDVEGQGIEVLGLSKRTEAALLNSMVGTVNKLRSMDAGALMALPGIGLKALDEIAAALEVLDGKESTV